MHANILPMALVGVGLVLLGALAWFLLPKPGETRSTDQLDSYTWAVPVEVDYPAPELKLMNLQGQPVSLADFRGKVVLVNNWATWCPPCKDEMPTLQAYYQEHKNQDFDLVGIEAGEPVADVAEFINQLGLTFNVWPDLEQKALVAFRSYSLPSSYVIDRDGQVRLAWFGPINRKMLEEYVTPLFKE